MVARYCIFSTGVASVKFYEPDSHVDSTTGAVTAGTEQTKARRQNCLFVYCCVIAKYNHVSKLVVRHLQSITRSISEMQPSPKKAASNCWWEFTLFCDCVAITSLWGFYFSHLKSPRNRTSEASLYCSHMPKNMFIRLDVVGEETGGGSLCH